MESAYLGGESYDCQWASIMKEFTSDIKFNWEACMSCGLRKVGTLIHWSLPPFGILKFKVNGATKGKTGLSGIDL